jgi:hypothetical protein
MGGCATLEYAVVELQTCAHNKDTPSVYIQSFGVRIAQSVYDSTCSRRLDPWVAGFCMAYLVFISRNLSTMTHAAAAWFILLMLPALLALAMLRGVTALAPFSLVADAANVAGVSLERPVCLPACLPACLPVRRWNVLCFCLSACVPVHLSAGRLVRPKRPSISEMRVLSMAAK